MSTALFVIEHKIEANSFGYPYLPILAGAINKEKPAELLGDDEGDNISAVNKTYNEMTAIYWVYRHLDEFKDADHIGFCHYRRLFCFNDFKNPIYVRKSNVSELTSIDESKLSSYWKEFDGIIPYKNYCRSVRRHYEKAHNKEDLDIVEKIIKEKAPKYLDAYKSYVDGGEEYLYNMFIFKRDDFKEYGDFIFPVLEEFCKNRPYPNERLFVSERLTGAFILYLIERGERLLPCPLLFIRSRSLKAAFKEAKANFKQYPEHGFLFKTKPIWLTLLPRFLEQRLRNRTRV